MVCGMDKYTYARVWILIVQNDALERAYSITRLLSLVVTASLHLQKPPLKRLPMNTSTFEQVTTKDFSRFNPFSRKHTMMCERSMELSEN